MVLRISTAWLGTPLDVDRYPTAWYARKRWEWPSMTKSLFIVAGSLRPALTEGGLTQMRAGSGPQSTRPARSGSGPQSTRPARSGSGPQSTRPARSGFGPQSTRPVRPGSGPQSTLQSSLVGFSYRTRLLAVRVEEGLARLVAEGARHAGGHRAGQLEGIRGARAEEPQRRGHAPEETITLHEVGRQGRIDRAGGREGGERGRGRALACLGVVVAVHELERLDEELDVDEPAAPVLHVDAAARLLAELALHPRAHLDDLLERRPRQGVAVDEPVERGARAPGERAVAENQARARQRLPLPQVAVLQIVLLERRDARGEAAPFAAGPQAQVDRESDAGRRDVAEHPGQPLDGQAVEPVGVDPLGAVGRAVLAEHDEQVEIGAGHQLTAAELAEAHDDRRDEVPGAIAGNAVALDEWLLGQDPAGGHRRLRQRGHLARVPVDRGDAEDVAPHHGQLLGLLHSAQPIAPLGRRRSGNEEGRHGLAQDRFRLPRQDALGIRQRRQQLGLGDQELGEMIAARADLDEAEKEIGILDEQLDESRPRTGGPEQPLELVQGLVGVGALPERVEE